MLPEILHLNHTQNNYKLISFLQKESFRKVITGRFFIHQISQKWASPGNKSNEFCPKIAAHETLSQTFGTHRLTSRCFTGVILCKKVVGATKKTNRLSLNETFY